MPRGGARPGAGRKPGQVNQITKDLRSKAREHADEALKTLVDVMRHGESQAVRKDAANAILDRGYGRPGQHVEIDADVRNDVLVTAISLVGREDSK